MKLAILNMGFFNAKRLVKDIISFELNLSFIYYFFIVYNIVTFG
jgi:hypothetical protein